MPKENKKRRELPPEVASALKDIVRSCEIEDDYIRHLQIKTWKKLEEFWHGIQFIFWSEIANDWMTPAQGLQIERVGEETRDKVGPFYDYVINIYKSRGESIISALSQSIPSYEFFPDDADSTDDLTASQAKNHLAVIYQKHIKAKLQFIDALFKIYNQGIVFAYRYRHAEESYGTHQVKRYKREEVEKKKLTCPECGKDLESIEPPNIPTCPECNMQGVETPYKEEVTTSFVEEVPKERECLEIYGPLNVKVPYYAREQKEFGYLIFYIEKHYAYVRSLYPEWYNEINPDSGNSRERWARTPSTYSTAWRGGSEDTNLTSVKRVWLRPWQYCQLSESQEEVKKYLEDKFPKGIHFVIVGENIVDFYEENMDVCWTAGKGSPSTFIHSDPVGQALAPIQELINQITNMTAQTIDYGIPALFADKRVLNFDVFGNQEASPGMITPVRKPSEFNSISDGFYEQKIATPSKEIETFRGRLDSDGEFVTGDYPSIHGGEGEGSKTLGEYVQSTHRALARLNLIYEYMKVWFGQVVDKGVTAMAEDIAKYGDSESTVVKEQGQFENITVRPEDLIGSAKNLEPEGSENFPLSSDQKMSLLMELIRLNNPMVNSVIGHPENSHIITEALGFPDLYIPGEAQRFKALYTIKQLLGSEPKEQTDEAGEIKNIPASRAGTPLIPDPTVDEEEIQIAVFKYFLSSSKGMQVRASNPKGYANCRAYQDLLQDSYQHKQDIKTQKQMEQIEYDKRLKELIKRGGGIQ